MAADSGVNHFLPKPYDTRQLLTMVHRILQEKNPHRALPVPVVPDETTVVSGAFNL